jgi:peroxiredoxin
MRKIKNSACGSTEWIACKSALLFLYTTVNNKQKQTPMKKLIFGIVTLLIISCNDEAKTEFSLSGKTTGFENGTTLLLDVDNVTIDSAKIQSDSFVFNTKLSESPLKAVLRTKDLSDYRFLWLEKNAMTFDATDSDFKNALVSGSKEEGLSQKLHHQIKDLPRSKQFDQKIKFIEENPSSLHSAYILSVYSTTLGKEKTKELFQSFSPNNKATEYGIEIAKYIELNKNPQIGDKYVDFKMTDTNDEIRSLSEFEGKLLLLEFWASNCRPCRKENPNLVKTYEEFKPKGFEIFAVSEDIKKESWLRAIKKDKLPWTQVSDLNRKNSASLIYGINGIPDNFLIAENGVIIGRNLRGEELNKKLKEILE